MAKEWRFGIVGTGTVGEWHVRVTPKVPGATLVALCDVVPDKAHKAAEKNGLAGVPVYDSIEAMLAKEDLDVVTVCTPSGNHLEPLLTAIKAGKNVISEKPLEIKLDRLDQIVEAAKAKGVKLAGIFQNRWNEANRALRDAAQEGRFGRIAWAGSFTPWHRTDQYYRDGGWRGTWKLDGGGAIMNQSVHAVDLLQWIVGPVKSVSAYASSRIHAEIEVEDTLSASLEFANGGYGTIMGTTAMYPGQAVRIEVGGEDGTGVSENGLKVFKFRDERPGDQALLEQFAPQPSDIWKERLTKAGGDPLLEQLGLKGKASTAGGASATDVGLDLHGKNLDAILRSWDAGQEAETAGPEARKAVAIIVAMYESARKGGMPIRVE